MTRSCLIHLNNSHLHCVPWVPCRQRKKGNMLWLGKSNVMGVGVLCATNLTSKSRRVALEEQKNGTVFDRTLTVLPLSPASCLWLKDMASRMRKELLAILIFLMATPLRAFVGWWSVENPVKQHVRFLRFWIRKHTIASLNRALFLKG